MAIKKAFVPLMEFLETNQDKKVKSVMDELTAFMSAKARGAGGASTYLKDASGKTVAVLDYYFKKWMPVVGPEAVEFSPKASSASGFNSMCKEGVSNWTKQQRDSKNALTQLLLDLEAGEVALEDLAAVKEQIETARKTIVKTDLGFNSEEEMAVYFEDNGVELSN